MTRRPNPYPFRPVAHGLHPPGNIRSALYPWAFARANSGDFILRIEDTDLERSTPGRRGRRFWKAWPGCSSTHDEGPFYQDAAHGPLQRGAGRSCRTKGLADPCYMSMARAGRTARAPDGRTRKSRATTAPGGPSPAKPCRPCPKACSPCCALKRPKTASSPGTTNAKAASNFKTASWTTWSSPARMARPRYNFCVCVDDMDMQHHPCDSW